VAISRSRVDSPGGRGATKVTEVVGRDAAREEEGLCHSLGGVWRCVFSVFSFGSIVSVAEWLHGGGVVEPVEV
jgi:hypothetical protein